MKQRLKTITKVITLLFLMGLSSCQNDFDEDISPNQNQKIQHKSLNDVLKDLNFTNSLSKISKKHKISNKSINTPSENINGIEQEFGFDISDQEVNVANTDSITSYTMLITRDNSTPNEFENLIVQVDNQDKMSAYILKYTNNTEITSDFNITEFEGQKSIDLIITEDPMLYTCIVLENWYCYGNLHHTTSEGCTMGYATHTNYCFGGGGSGGGPGGGSSGGSGGSSSGSGSSSPVITVPVVPVKPDEKKCALFNKLKNDTQFKEIIEFLKTKINEPTETGYALTKTPTGYDALPGVPDPTKKYAIAFTIPNGTTVDILTHVHNTGGLSIFSLEDIEQMYKVFRDNYDSLDSGQTFISVVVTPNGEVYALTITDRAAFVQTYLAFLNTEEKLYKTRITFDNDPSLFNSSYFGINSGHTREDNEKNFLRFIGNTAGIKLHKANADLSQWNPLKLNALSGVEKEPACN